TPPRMPPPRPPLSPPLPPLPPAPNSGGAGVTEATFASSALRSSAVLRTIPATLGLKRRAGPEEEEEGPGVPGAAEGVRRESRRPEGGARAVAVEGPAAEVVLVLVVVV